jgi:protein tyrosine/serine phosphatase
MKRFRILAWLALATLPTTASADLNESEIAPGLYRGRVPKSEADFAALQRLGIRTVLNIRGNAPLGSWLERRRVEAHGLNYLKLRMGFHPLRDGTGDRLLAAMADESLFPIYLHCQFNRDRTSAIVAAYRVQVQGWDIASAETEAREFGLRRFFLGLNRYVRWGGVKPK